ncbi:lysophospholipid acyltransferase family protein [bacterium]|nr:lysophospholipid acyltransferase family protein [bacterium]
MKNLKLFLVPRIIKWLVTIIGFTCGKKWIGLEHLKELEKNNQNWIYSSWHNNITFNALLLKNQNLVSMVSSSTDGKIAASVLELMGNKTIRGSSSRGGAKVLFSMIKEIRSGRNGAITPDGPRGPRYKLQGGIISISQKSNAPLVPFHVESTNLWVFEKSWDKHKFPKPFSTIVVSIGKPFWVPSKIQKEKLEEIRKEFENAMMENVKQAEDAIIKLRKKNEI